MFGKGMRAEETVPVLYLSMFHLMLDGLEHLSALKVCKHCFPGQDGFANLWAPFAWCGKDLS